MRGDLQAAGLNPWPCRMARPGEIHDPLGFTSPPPHRDSLSGRWCIIKDGDIIPVPDERVMSVTKRIGLSRHSQGPFHGATSFPSPGTLLRTESASSPLPLHRATPSLTKRFLAMEAELRLEIAYLPHKFSGASPGLDDRHRPTWEHRKVPQEIPTRASKGRTPPSSPITVALLLHESTAERTESSTWTVPHRQRNASRSCPGHHNHVLALSFHHEHNPAYRAYLNLSPGTGPAMGLTFNMRFVGIEEGLRLRSHNANHRTRRDSVSGD